MPSRPLLFLVAMLTACAGERGHDGGIVRDSLDGVPRIITTTAAGAGFDIALSGPFVEIGRVDGPEEEVFGTIPAAVIGLDGRVYVADGQARAVSVFAADGTFLARFGRDGDGPGEFRGLDGLTRAPNGDILARDPRLGRLSRFTPDGEFVSSFRLTRLFPQYADRLTLWTDSAGRIFDFVTLSIAGPLDTAGVVVYSNDGTPEDTVITMIHEPARAMVTRNGMPFMALRLPYSASPLVAVDPQGRIITGDGAAYRIAVHSASGFLSQWIERVAVPAAVPPEAADSVEARLRRALQDAQTGAVERYTMPEVQPFFTEILVDPAGNLWVAREGEFLVDPEQYDIFDRAGAFLGRVRTPRMRVLGFFDDLVVGRPFDSDGVPSVGVYRVAFP